MRAYTGDYGIDITLILKDKEEGERTSRIVCQSNERKKPIVTIHIVNEVERGGFLEEPGFHIEAKPTNVGPDEREKYDIFLSKKRFEELTNPEGNPIVDGGYFVSRSKFDRIDIKYFAV